MPSLEPVALVGGTGRLGPGLALRFALAGVPVRIGSRQRDKGVAAAADVAARVAAAGGGAAVTGHDNAEAAEGAPRIAVTVPYEGQIGLLPGLAPACAGKVVVSTGVAMTFDPVLGPTHVDVPEGSAAEQVAALLPGSRVTAAFHSLSSAVLVKPERSIDSDVIVTGDDAEAKRATMELAELIAGVRAVDGGPLRYARYSELLTVLLLSLNRVYKGRHTGIVVTDLPEA